MTEDAMWVVIRFQIEDAQSFRPDAEAVVAHWRGSAGCLEASLVRNLDETSLWALISKWATVGDYRRSFSGTQSKLLLTPLLLQALDEPSAFLPPDEVSDPVWRDPEGGLPLPL